MIGLTVTYGSRDHLLERTLSSAFRDAGLDHVVVVNNGADFDVEIICKKYLQHITIINLPKNIGSAGGFSRGLDLIFNSFDPADLLVIFDDDHELSKDFVTLTQDWNNVLKSTCPDFVLYAYRGLTRAADNICLKFGLPKEYYINAYCGWSMRQKLAHIIFKFLRSDRLSETVIQEVFHGPYGGLIARIELLQKIGLPREEYFVYADDHEYTSRFFDFGIKQFLVKNPSIVDYWDLEQKKSVKILDNPHLFYSLRNHIAVSRKFRVGLLEYRFNQIFYFLQFLTKVLIQEKSIFACLRSFRILWRANTEGKRFL